MSACAVLGRVLVSSTATAAKCLCSAMLCKCVTLPLPTAAGGMTHWRAMLLPCQAGPSGHHNTEDIHSFNQLLPAWARLTFAVSLKVPRREY